MGLVLLEQCPNVRTFDAFFKCERHLIDHHKILVSVSGGSDSDIMLDHLQKVLEENKFNYDCEIHYVWFDTGLEYKVTKEHLDYLENKYNIKIERIRPKVPVPLGCKIYGVPFLTKYVSQMLSRLQEHNFDFKNDGNKSYEELMSKYPNMKSALRFWCCHNDNTNIKDKSHFNIINRQRMANEQRFISATELDNLIANKMQEMGKVSALKAMQQLIDEIHEKNQRKKHIL